MLDEDDVSPPDRLRILILYLLYRDGILPADMQKLLSHAQLPPQDGAIIANLELLGARTSRNLKDSRPVPSSLFPKRAPAPGTPAQEDLLLSRFEPALQNLLEAHAQGTLDPTIFPYTKPPLDLGTAEQAQSAGSLRTVSKPTWAKSARSTAISTESRQRVLVFMAGGATYSESRACYDVGRATSREVFLVTSHMLTPTLFVRQVADLSQDKRRLGIPAEAPKPQAPAHLFEPDEVPKPPPQRTQQVQQQAPAPAMANLNLNGSRPNGTASASAPMANSSAKLSKDPPAPEKEKKKRHAFGFGKHK